MAYSSKPGALVNINGRLLHQGDEQAAGHRLDYITAGGMACGGFWLPGQTPGAMTCVRGRPLLGGQGVVVEAMVQIARHQVDIFFAPVQFAVLLPAPDLTH